MKKESVLITGASGSMGFSTFEALWKLREKYEIVLLVRPSSKNKSLFQPYIDTDLSECRGVAVYNDGDLKIVWGDATSYEDILQACEGVDVVLNMMAVIPPAADRDPIMTEAVNKTAVGYLVDAIKAQPDGANHIRLIHIGTVAQYGDRQCPMHMIRVGDPLIPSVFDIYAASKIAGEKIVIESGIKHWVSLRQTLISVPNFLETNMDPIMFHQPIHNAIEMVTGTDSGKALTNALAIEKSSDFWGKVYNMAGGPSCRFVILDYMKRVFEELGMGSMLDIFERKWFALRNFRCGWFADSGKLNEYLHFWNENLDDHFDQVKSYMGITSAGDVPVTPPEVIRAMIETLVDSPNGTRHWRNHNLQRIKAFYGSIDAYDNIPDWGVAMPPRPEQIKPRLLDHGYDDNKLVLDLHDLQQAAAFRGGSLISTDWDGDLSSKLKWRDAAHNEFEASPSLILKAGHWSPFETSPPWDFDRIARSNPFIAQVWYNRHELNESNFYGSDNKKGVL